MTETAGAEVAGEGPSATAYDLGGLHFEISFRGPGATLRVFGERDSRWEEVLRFDDFVEGPHFHAPAENRMIFDRSLGEPLAWYIAQIRDHTAEWFERAGYADLLEGVDVEEVSKSAPLLEQAMIDCVPVGYARVPGVGLQRV